jgi:hypothetical protein
VTAPLLQVEIPRTYAAERAYAARLLLRTFLGYEPRIREGDVDRVVITVDDEGASLSVRDGLFAMPPTAWLTPSSLPREPVSYRDVRAELPGATLTEAQLPILYEADGDGRLVEHDAATGTTELRLDVFGGAFYTVTRYEERVTDGMLDEHGRFAAASSLATRAGFLQRPLANEYAEVLGAALRTIWPGLPQPRRDPAVWLTHDVDWPLVSVWRRPREVLRSAVADVVARRAPSLARRRLAGWLRGRRGDYTRDPGDTFGFLMSVAEQAGLRATFNVLAGGSAPLDGRYRLTDPWIRGLLRRIAGRGHEVGFHGSYEAYDDPHMLESEFRELRRTAAAVGIEQSFWSGRQHFLRWRNPVTWRLWDDAGLNVDSSVYFAEAPGFRTGSCQPYPVFDLDRREELGLVEAPLTLMDVSASRYQLLDAERTLEQARLLGRTCRALGGTFVLLWHNDAVMTEPSRQLYRDVVMALA